MRGHKREAARRVSLMLVIVGWCAALVLCSCEGTEEGGAKREKRAERQKQEQEAREQRLGAQRLSIRGKWSRPGEKVEFMSLGRMMVVSPDKLGRVKPVFFTYRIKREGEITLRPVGLVRKDDLRRGNFRISGDTLNLKMWDEARARVYSRVHR